MRHGFRVRLLPGSLSNPARLQLRAGTERNPRPFEGIETATADRLRDVLRRYAHARQWQLPCRADHGATQRHARHGEMTGATDAAGRQPMGGYEPAGGAYGGGLFGSMGMGWSGPTTRAAR